jgi:GT2 family glycosyltransferase
MEKIGVVTVTYNSSEVIDKFLEDLFNQKFPNFFLYVVDNASTDSSLEKINKLKESRVKIIKNSINKGVASANNKGISSALKDNCSHILLLNNDVEFGDNLFEILIKSIRSDKYSLVSPKINFFDNQNVIWYAGGVFNKYNGFFTYSYRFEL